GREGPDDGVSERRRRHDAVIPAEGDRAVRAGRGKRNMEALTRGLVVVLMLGAAGLPAQTPPVDSSLAAFIATIRAVDNHTHVSSTAPRDSETDALPLDGLPAFDFPARLRPDNPEWANR